MFSRLKKLHKLYNSKLGYEEKYFIDEYDRGIIDIGAENYDDLFSYYDIDGKSVLDKEFIEFIEMKADSIPLKKDITLCFHVPDADEEKRLEIEKTLKDTYIRKSHIITRKIEANRKFSLTMLIIGLILLAVALILEIKADELGIVNYVYAFVYMAAEVFGWEALDSFFLDSRDLQDELLSNYRFVQSRIVIKEYFSQGEKKAFSNNAKKLSNMINSTKNMENNQQNTD